MILLCYDGSPDAQAAIAHTGGLMPGAEAMVLTIWVDASRRDAALEQAVDGARRATAAGLVAQPRIANGGAGIADAIVAEAEAVGAHVVALGTRGLGRVKSILLGSVSRHVVQHAGCPVLVVPSADGAELRDRWARQAEAAPGT